MDAENEIQNIIIAETQPMTAKKKGFRPTAAEIALAVGMYIIAYLYVAALPGKGWWIFFPLLYVLAVEYMYRDTPRTAESWVWLCSLLIIVLSKYFDRGRAWDEFVSYFSVHILAVWWFMSRSGKLLEKNTGAMLPVDALDGFVLFPFGHFFMRLRTLLGSFGAVKSGRKGTWMSLLGIVITIGLLVKLLKISANTLAEADTGFGMMLKDLYSQIKISDQTVLYFFLSIPVGMYLFGQIAGSRRVESEKLKTRYSKTLWLLEKIRIVPGSLWIFGSIFFCILYAAFILWQGSYLFGAFTRSLPEDFVVSEYARQGFFELCKVVMLNFVLFWLILRTSEKNSERGMRATKIMCTLILAASFLFTIIAMSKLGLYISNFAFTPRRIESCWLIVVLAVGCVAALFTLWTEKKSLRVWLMFGTVSFALLHLY